MLEALDLLSPMAEQSKEALVEGLQELLKLLDAARDAEHSKIVLM